MNKFLFIITLLIGTLSSLHAQKKFHTCYEVTADEFHAWCQAIPQLVIIDIREDSAFLKKHIPGAILATSDSMLFSISDTLDADEKLIVYDKLGNESIDACMLLASRGKGSVYHLKGGFIVWEKLNFRVETSDKNR